MYSLARTCHVKIAAAIYLVKYSTILYLTETTDGNILKSHILSLRDIGYPAISHFNCWILDLLFPCRAVRQSRCVVINQPSRLHLIRVRWDPRPQIFLYISCKASRNASQTGKRYIDVVLVAEATATANRKDIRDGIGISFNPSFRAVGRDSIYGVIRVCTTLLFPCSLFCANTPVNPDITQALLCSSAIRCCTDLNSCTTKERKKYNRRNSSYCMRLQLWT